MDLRFSNHALHRMKCRGLLEEEVIQIIKFPETIRKRGNLYYYRGKIRAGKVEVCAEKIGDILNIITVYWL